MSRAFGTGHAQVLRKLASRVPSTWSSKDGIALYETRALTDILCQGLVTHGLLDEQFDGVHSVYTVNANGQLKAAELKGNL